MDTPIRWMYENKLDDATVTATDATTGFPVTYIQNAYPQQPYRTLNVTGTKNINIDHGSAKHVNCVVVSHHNLTAGATLQFYKSTNGSAYTLVETMNVFRVDDDGDTVIVDPIVIFCDSVTERYNRIAVADASNSDGYIQIGRAFLGTYREFAKNYNHGWKLWDEDLSRIIMADNGVEHADVKPQRAVIELLFDRVAEAQKNYMRKIVQSVGIHTPFYVSLRPDNLEHDIYSKYCKIADVPQPDNPFARNWNWSIILKEQL